MGRFGKERGGKGGLPRLTRKNCSFGIILFISRICSIYLLGLPPEVSCANLSRASPQAFFQMHFVLNSYSKRWIFFWKFWICSALCLVAATHVHAIAPALALAVASAPALALALAFALAPALALAFALAAVVLGVAVAAAIVVATVVAFACAVACIAAFIAPAPS